MDGQKRMTERSEMKDNFNCKKERKFPSVQPPDNIEETKKESVSSYKSFKDVVLSHSCAGA